MDPQLPVIWQVHPQDSQSQSRRPIPFQTSQYSHVPVGPALSETVDRNDKIPSFAQRYPTINRIQHLLSDGQYQQYLFHVEHMAMEVDMEKFLPESIAFLHEQNHAIHGDIPILTAYGDEIRDLELELLANADEAPGLSAISLAAGRQTLESTRDVKKAILLMMRSRFALLWADVDIRRQLFQIDLDTSKYNNVVTAHQLRIKDYLMSGRSDEHLFKYDLHQLLAGLLPLNSRRAQWRVKLQQCRQNRAVLEEKLREADARLEVIWSGANRMIRDKA